MILSEKKNEIVVKVKVKRGLTPQQVLDGTGRKQYRNNAVVQTMPLENGEGEEEVELVFFKVGRYLHYSEVEVEHKQRGLVQDLAAQAQYNADHPEFATEHPNGAQWDNEDGQVSFVTFDRDFSGERVVRCYRIGLDWDDFWWFAGRRPANNLGA